nr:uncharacterized protein CTRU02_09547 [Colletotrichum truncatum]KAF6788229.1 hypothetical protein CTRU02_09547 [Colletotrichum truncatum]
MLKGYKNIMRNKGSYVEPGESLGRSSDPLAPITRHVRIEKNGARGHRCLTCRPPKVFLNTLDLKAHRASKHDNEKHSCRETEFDLTLNNSRSRRYHVENQYVVVILTLVIKP